MMKKTAFWAIFLIALFILLLCSSAGAEPLTLEEIKARNGNITEEEKTEYLESLDHMEDGHDLSVGPDYTVADRKIIIDRIQMNVSVPDESDTQTVYIPMQNSYYELDDDVILVQETNGSRFNGRPEEGTAIALDSGIQVDSGDGVLQEGSKVLILEDNGDLHAMYAGEGTDGTTLVAGEELYVMRSFKSAELHNAKSTTFKKTKDGWDIPISFAGISFLDGSGYVTAGKDGKLNIRIDYSEDMDWSELEYDLKLKDFSVGIDLPNLTVHIDRHLTWFSVEVPLLTVEFPLDYGFEIDMAPTLSLEGEGKGDTVLSVSAREGFGITLRYGVYPDDEHWNHTEPEIKLIDTDMEGEIYYGISWGPGVSWAGLAGIACVYKVGAVVSAEANNNDFDPSNPKDEDWHVCGKDMCLEGSAFTRFGPLSIVANFLKFGSTTIKKIAKPKDSDPFAEYYISKTFGDRSTSTSECPHWAYRLNVYVEDQDGTPIPGASVYYRNVPEHYEKYASATTDGDGLAVLCTATGEIEVVAEVADPDNPSWPFTVSQTVKKKDKGESVTLQLDLPEKYVYFKNSLVGEATSWPSEIDFKPFHSKSVCLPDMLPEMAGYQFICWNTARDGSGTSYAPGSMISISDDLTLWAQWEVQTGKWFVSYVANSSIKTPQTQIIPLGQDAVLSGEYPEAEGMIFRGWTPNLEKMDPVYWPGETLKYNPLVNSMVLYAIWDLSPISLHVHIVFDPNGLKATLPKDMWFEHGSWVYLMPAEPPQGSIWEFAGWSTDPNAKTPEYLANHSYYFSQSTLLYAVWKKQDTLTLTFRDSTSGSAEGIPAPISIVVSISHKVKIPSAIPEKTGWIFTGWNTAKDGSGEYYFPGSVFTLTEDTTVWAQWIAARSTWYVFYDANGGTKAPAPQAVPLDTNAVVTSELPEGERMVFKGWARNPQDTDPVYQPGDTLEYDSEKIYTVLYAVWHGPPEDQPAVITFDANGGLQDTVPPSITVQRITWLNLPETKPVWDDRHEFLGWSRDPKATEAEMMPGDAVIVTSDTKLFAVWKQVLPPTPEDQSAVITFDANGGRQDTVPPSISVPKTEKVRLPETNPIWDNQHEFLGWSRDPKAAEEEIAPGGAAVFSTDTKLYAVWETHYKVIEGGGSSWVKGSGEKQRFVANGNKAYFTEFRIDEKRFTDGVEITSGSTVADIKAWAMEKLSAGTHTVTFVYKDGKASAKFFVEPKKIPKTGDSSNPALWIGMIILGLLGIGGLIFRTARKRR